MSFLDISIDAKFVDAPIGQRMCINCEPKDESTRRGSVLIVPPFTEEMNKSRRMMSRLCRLLAERGFHAILPDYYGTGDSSGNFVDASWENWIEDLKLALDQCKQEGNQRLNIVALRGGALLATAFIQKFELELDKLVFWHPVTSGDMWLTQFLRLRIAASMASGEEKKETVKELKELLNNGVPVEVAGYEVPPGLAKSLMSSKLEAGFPTLVGQIVWLDLVPNQEKTMTVMNKKLIEKFSNEMNIVSDVAVGPQFWSTTEIVEVDDLLQKTLSYF